MTDRTMLHAGSCDFCDHQGWLGFYLCGDGKTLILLCDECDTVWTSPQEIGKGAPTGLGEPPDFIVEQLGVSAANGRDATRAEIHARGWADFIQGEYLYRVKGKGRP